MKRLIGILTLTYYSLGTLILPYADFSLIPELPRLYSHCKATEDNDMNLADFITDHLMNIDGVFDKHNNGDDQKPHQSFVHEVSSPCVFLASPLIISTAIKTLSSSRKIQLSDTHYCFDFVGNIFRPPIV